MVSERIQLLISRLMSGSATEAEAEELAGWTEANTDDESLADALISVYDNLQPDLPMPVDMSERLLSGILRHRQAVIRQMDNTEKRFRRLRWPVVAASIILLLGAGYFLFFNQNKRSETIRPVMSSDVQAPTANRAVITLANGQKVFLDSAINGQLVKQGNASLIKKADGQIAYSHAINGEGEILYNTLTNPQGSKVISLTLSDGTQVWLNAGSSVTYPVAFIGNERKVSITGEAYFEVTHDASRPFKVGKDEMEITVLGTHFNVNAYDDERNLKITLLEGSVKVSDSSAGSGVQQTVLSPGEQVVLAAGGDMKRTGNVDLEETVAWVNGRFQFKSSDLESLMRQIARWYDVKVIYEGKVTKKFSGKIPRTMSAMNVFKVLEETGGVHFSIEDKTIRVRP